MVMLVPSLFVAATPEGMGKVSHQTLCAGGGGPHGFQVEPSSGFTQHCPGGMFAGFVAETTYIGVVPSGSVEFGAKTSVTWNGLMWMWNGWEMLGVLFVTFHSSALFKSTDTPTSPLNCLPLM